MPAPTTAYLPINSNESALPLREGRDRRRGSVSRLLALQPCLFLECARLPVTTGSAFILRRSEAPPIVADGNQIRSASSSGRTSPGAYRTSGPRAASRPWPPRPRRPRDRLGHDLVRSRPAGPQHLLGWHKWQLRWIDPAQLTCLSAPGTVEETLTPDGRPRRQEARRRPYQRHIRLRGRGASAHRLRQERVRGGSPRLRDRLDTRDLRGSRSSSRGRRAAATSLREHFAPEGCTTTST